MSTAYKKMMSNVIVPIYLVLILWVIHILKLTFNLNLSSYGVIARDWSGVKGIFTAPFIHGSIQHLMSNSVPLFVLSTMIILFYRKVAYQSILLIYVMTGAAVWMFSRPYVSHIGASGVVYGLVSFVFWSGLFRRNIKSIVLALIVTILYSGYALGVLPNLGAFVGIIVAFWYRDVRESDEEKEEPSWANESSADSEFFLPRDAFDMTREERQRAQLEDDMGDIWTSDKT